MPTIPSPPSLRAARLALAALALVLALPLTAAAQPKVSVEAPLLPLARAGSFTPVHVNIATTTPLQGEVRVSFGDSSSTIVRPYSVGRQSARRVSVPVQMPNWVRELTVTVTSGRKELANVALTGASPGAGVDELHVVAIGEDPLGLTTLRTVTGQPIIGHSGCMTPRDVKVETLLPGALPNVWFGWTSVDLVVWRRPAPSELNPEQQAALRDWVRSGGTLVVGLGDNWQAWTGSPLGALSGVQVQSAEPSSDALAAIADLAQSARPAEGALPILDFSYGTAEARPIGGLVPLANHGFGAGRVVTLGFDPGAGELRGLIDRETLWRRLLGLAAPEAAPYSASGSPHRRSPDPCQGTSDEWGWGSQSAAQKTATWRTNLENSLSAFSRANPLPLGTVLLFGFVYLLLIGPVDYVIARTLGKPMLTWVTFPVIAIAFSVLAAAVISFQKAGDTELRCVEVVDWFGDDGLRGSGWCSMWSSRRQSVRIPVPRGEGVVLAGGGADATELALAGGSRSAIIEPTRVGLSFRASQWAVSTWRSAWVADADGSIAAVPTDDGLLVSNRSGFALENAHIVTGRKMWPVGTLADGASQLVGRSVSFDWGTITGDPDSPAVEFDDRSYRASIDGMPQDWSDSWAMLRDPHTEHVGRLPPLSVPDGPVLVARVSGGLAPPVPESRDAVVQTFTILRAALPRSIEEALP